MLNEAPRLQRPLRESGMEIAATVLCNEKTASGMDEKQTRGPWLVRSRGIGFLYTLALTLSIGIWFIAIRAPLRGDETGSYWVISRGISGILQRQSISLCPPGYFYILLISTKLLGTSEFALRIPSVLAMLGAAYLLYLVARELIDSEFAAIATIVFSLDYIVVFEAIDVRPYAYAVLLTNAAILTLLRLRRNDSNWLAALFGLLAAGIVYLHFLFAAILPAFLVCFIVFKARSLKILVRQGCVALVVFAVACIPLVAGLRYLFHTANSHVVVPPPGLLYLIPPFMPGWLILSATLTALYFIARDRPIEVIRFERWQVLFAVCLASIPIVILFVVSVAASLNVFSSSDHRLSAVPGISLCWAMIVYCFRSKAVRATFCVLFVGLTVSFCVFSPKSRTHDFSWRDALRVVEDMSSRDNTPVVVCSNFIEANYATMPTESPKTDRLFPQLSYYKLTAPVVPLPETLNDETRRVFLPFLREAEQKHERFLAVGADQPLYSSAELDWIAQTAADKFSVRTVGIYDEVKVLEFVPRDGPAKP